MGRLEGDCLGEMDLGVVLLAEGLYAQSGGGSDER